MSGPVERVGARVLLFDPAGRVLLIHEQIDEPGSGRTHWITPGGGVDPGEALPAAAERELWEELGLRVSIAPDAPQVHENRREWHWRGTTYRQTDHYFAATIAAQDDFEHPALTEQEQATVLGERWWTPDELAASDETFVPVDIVAVLRHLAASAR